MGSLITGTIAASFPSTNGTIASIYCPAGIWLITWNIGVTFSTAPTYIISYVVGLNIPQFSYTPGFTSSVKNCLSIIQSYSTGTSFTMQVQYTGGSGFSLSGAGELSYINAVRIG